MSTSNTGALLRRFVAICQAEVDINTRPSHPLNRPPGEWPHLSDLLSSLLQSCPPSRLAILSFVHPIIVAHLQAIFMASKPTKGDKLPPHKRKYQPPPPSPSEAFILDVLSTALDVCKREAVVQNIPNSFAAELCTFALDLLGPICSPAYCNSRCYLKRKRIGDGPGSSSGRRRRRIVGPSSDLDSPEDASEIDDPSGNETNTSGTYESDSDALVVIEEDLQDDGKFGLEESDISPDLRPNKFNLALLGNFWSYSAVVKELLRIVFSCIVSQRYATPAAVERLVACAVPAEIKSSKLSLYPAKHPMDITACVPHWCMKWLIKQVADAVGQNSANQAIIDRFCRNVLDICLCGPHRNGGPEYARFWAITGLANLVYVGIYFPDQLRASITAWMETKFSELERGSKSSSNLINVFAPLIVLSPKDPSALDRYPQNSKCSLCSLMTVTLVPPQRNRPRPSAMDVARGFLSHEFHSIFPCVHVREFATICASMRRIALTAAHNFLLRLSTDFSRLESVMENLMKGVPNGSFQELEYAVVDGICATSGECRLSLLLSAIPN